MFHLSLAKDATTSKSIDDFANGVKDELNKVGLQENVVRTCILEYLVPFYLYINRAQNALNSRETILQGRWIGRENETLMYENPKGKLVIRNLITAQEITMPLPEGESVANKMRMKGEHLITVSANSKILSHYQWIKAGWKVIKKEPLQVGRVTSLTSDFSERYFYLTSVQGSGRARATRYDRQTQTFCHWITNIYGADCFQTLANGNILYSSSSFNLKMFLYETQTKRVYSYDLKGSYAARALISPKYYIFLGSSTSIFSLFDGQRVTQLHHSAERNEPHFDSSEVMANGDYFAFHFPLKTGRDLIEIHHLFDLNAELTYSNPQGRIVTYQVVTNVDGYSSAFTGNTLHFIVVDQQKAKIHITSFDLSQQPKRDNSIKPSCPSSRGLKPSVSLSTSPYKCIDLWRSVWNTFQKWTWTRLP